jgi:TIR domain
MASDCKCFFCNTTCEMHELPSRSYSCRYVCRYCGEYLLDPRDARSLSSEVDNTFKIACILNERRLQGLAGVALSDKTDMEDKVLDLPHISIGDILDDFPTKASQILNRSLKNLSRLPERPYDVIRRDFTEAGNYLMLFTSDQHGSYGFLKELTGQGYIRFNMVKGGPQFNVFFRTTQFWDKVEHMAQEETNHKTTKGLKNLTYDVFISHATEDKNAFVRPLAEGLTDSGLKVWYDEFELKLGDSLRQSIDNGLAKARYGIVVFSRAFFGKNWPQYELDGLLNRQMDGKKVILPIWHEVTQHEVSSYSPSLADKVAVETSKLSIDAIIKEIKAVVDDSND